MVFTTAATIFTPLNKFTEKIIFAINTVGKKTSKIPIQIIAILPTAQAKQIKK